MAAINTGPSDPISEITDLLQPLTSVVSSVTNALSGLVKSVVSGAADFVSEGLGSVFSSLMKVAGTIGESLMTVLAPVGAIILGAVAVVAAAFVAAVASIGLVVGLFTELIQVGASFVKVLSPQAAQELDRSMAELNATIAGAFLPMILEATRYIRQLADTIAPSMADIGQQIKQLFVSIEPIITGLASALIRLMPTIILVTTLFIELTAALIPVIKFLTDYFPAPQTTAVGRNMPGNIGALGTAGSVANIIESTSVSWQDALVAEQTASNRVLEQILTVLRAADAYVGNRIGLAGGPAARGIQFTANAANVVETGASVIGASSMNLLRRFFGGGR